MPLLWWGVVLCAIGSSDHLATGFSASSLDGRICSSTFSGLLDKRATRVGRNCWYAVSVDREEFLSTVPRTEEATDAVFDQETNVDTEDGSISPPVRKKKRKVSAAAQATFEIRFGELLEFKELHGHLMVPRRCGKLGDWVNKLRQRKDRLDEERLDRLNGIGFCWDASGDKRRKEREKWWERLGELPVSTVQQQQLGFCRIEDTAGSEGLSTTVNESSSSSSLSSSSSSSRSATDQPKQSTILSFENLTSAQKKWLRRQRVEYIGSGRKPSQKLEKAQIQALNEIDPNWWQTVSRTPDTEN